MDELELTDSYDAHGGPLRQILPSDAHVHTQGRRALLKFRFQGKGFVQDCVEISLFYYYKIINGFALYCTVVL